ncbi:MAG TPA: DNA repair protein RecO [Verrucomicrobiae bacterium]
MEERATGIILRSRTFTETSLVVQWLTADLGRIATVAKGARRPKSPFQGKLDLFYEADFSFQRSRRSELHTLREVQLTSTNAELRNDLAVLHQASYFAVLVEQSTETETPIPDIYELLKAAILTLPKAPPRARRLLAFELKLLALLGYEPELSALNGETRQLAQSLAEEPFETLENLRASTKTHHELNRFAQIAIGTMLDRLPPQREKALAALLPKTTAPSAAR